MSEPQSQVTETKRRPDHQMFLLESDGELDVKLDESAQLLIGHHLKIVYGEIVEQPVPDQFLNLLDELERKEQER
ncbi:MAG: NepR family anti-sigma factor [Vicinamibacterales bacterium]